MLGSILHGVGNVDLVSDDANPVGSEARGKLWIGERAAQRSKIKIVIENVDFPAIEISRQKKRAVERRQAFINCATGGVIESHICGVACAGPAGDEAILSVKDKQPALEIGTVPVRDRGRGTAGAAVTIRIVRGPRYGHDEPGILSALVIIESGCTAVIVGDPEVLPRKNRDSPGIQQLRIGSIRYAGSIRDQIGLGIAGLLSEQSRGKC